jgi:hypothetical protein
MKELDIRSARLPESNWNFMSLKMTQNVKNAADPFVILLKDGMHCG